MRARALLFALLAVAPFVPLAGAEHVYSHRFLVEGRVVGANGLPLAGIEVRVDAPEARLAQACGEGHRNVTDANGDFAFCYHRHEMTQEGSVTVTAGDATSSRPIDIELRRMVFLLLDPARNGTATRDWGTRYQVDGRVWERDPQQIEGVLVEGAPYTDELVNVTLIRGSDVATPFHVRTDGFGTYRVTFYLVEEEFPENVQLRVTARNATMRALLDPTFHRMTVDVRLPIVAQEPVRMPGLEAGPVSPWLVLAVALGGFAAVAMARRGKG